jgi:hypothetical protein
MLTITVTTAPPESAARGPPSPTSLAEAPTQSSDGAAPPEVLSGADNRRLKGLIKGRLFGDAAPPVRIGRYLVMRQLGAGGMGVVYAVYDEELDRRIAVKLLHADSPALSQSRLLREAQALAKLSHPNVVTVHEVGTFEGQVYIAMEYVRGQTLQEWLAAAPRPWREIVERFQAAGRGLAAAHAAGLVHRDFKPDSPPTPHPNAPQPADRLQSHEFGRSGGGGVFSRRAGFCQLRSPPGKTQAKSSGAIVAALRARGEPSHARPLHLSVLG